MYLIYISLKSCLEPRDQIILIFEIYSYQTDCNVNKFTAKDSYIWKKESVFPRVINRQVISW